MVTVQHDPLEVRRMPGQTSHEPLSDAAWSVEFSAQFGLSAESARATIHALGLHEVGPGRLAEWSSTDASGAEREMPPLFYAAWLPNECADDVPLGLGPSPADALADLMWALAAPRLATSLQGDDSPPESEDRTLSAGAAR
jgi:hypothetical protein